MARTLRRLTPLAGALPLVLLWALPLLLSLAITAASASDTQAWRALLAHPQLFPALFLSMFTGLAATLTALLLTLIILAGFQGTALWHRLQACAAAGLAVPHLAFAIGFGFLIMPSGLLARLASGDASPPAWITVQDPWGLSLTAALAVKEIPFLLTAAFAALFRGDAARLMDQHARAAASLGHGKGSIFLRIIMPQLLAQLRWPLVIVFVYGATVVDMALVLGPTQPPTFAVVAWHALNDVEPAANRMGLAATLLLTAILAMAILTVHGLLHASRDMQRRFLTAGPSALPAPRIGAGIIAVIISALLLLSIFLLLPLSAAPRWPWPGILPPLTGGTAWATLAASPAPLLLSLGLSLAVSAVSILIAVLWLETQPEARDRWLLWLALLSLAVPQLAVAGGQYRLFLDVGLGGKLAGLFLAHLSLALAYVMIVLSGPYRGFDGRYMKAARALHASPASALIRVKLPLLKAPLLTASAIGFAVSIVQYVPAQLIAAGRFATLPMEAVTLSSGGSRPLTAAYALALTLPPLAAFLLAGIVGRPRWR